MAVQRIGQVRRLARRLAAWLDPYTQELLAEENRRRRFAEDQLSLRGRNKLEHENFRFNLEVESEKGGPRCPEFTVLNFTTFDLRMDGLLKRYSLPHGSEKSFTFNDHVYLASVLRLREPLIYGKNVGAFQWGSSQGEAGAYRMAVTVTQAQIAAAILEKFNQRPVCGAFCLPKDARELPGVIAFMGSPDKLQYALDSGALLQIPVKSKYLRGSVEIMEVLATEYFAYQMANRGKLDEVATQIQTEDKRIAEGRKNRLG
jgi:hypothetical protein